MQDQAVAAEGAITDGGQVIEVKIALAGDLDLRLSAAQLLVLHLQFNLMDMQLMQLMQRLPVGLAILRLAARQGGRRQLRGNFFGALAKCSLGAFRLANLVALGKSFFHPSGP